MNGKVVTANSTVDYPAENTIADYYIVMTPKDESMNVNIVDDDENGEVLDSGVISGKFGDNVVENSDIRSKVKKLLDSGLYTLESNDLDNGLTFKDGSQIAVVRLKHKLDSIQRHYRVIEDLPDGTKKVVIDIEATLYKDADVDYYEQSGAYLNGTDQDHLLKPNDIRVIKGSGYTAPTDDNVVAPIDYLLGYRFQLIDGTNGYVNGVASWVDGSNTKYLAHCDIFNGVGHLNLTSGREAINVMPSRDFHIIYTKNQYPVTINYYDTAGKQISTSTTTHTYLDQVDANATAPAGYVLLSGQSTKLTVSWDHNELDLLVAPAITSSQESRTITRTITNDQGQVLAVQHVTFSRQTITNNIDHSVTHTAWIVDGPSEFAVYVPVLQAGYVADPVEAQAVTGDSEDSTVKVHYQSVNLRPVPKYIDANGVGYDTLPAGYEVVSGQDTNKDGLLIIKKPQNVQPTPIQYVTRTVTVIMPNGQKRYIHQKARKGTKFLKFHLPRLRGYAMTITGGSVDTMAADSDQNVTVVFTK